MKDKFKIWPFAAVIAIGTVGYIALVNRRKGQSGSVTPSHSKLLSLFFPSPEPSSLLTLLFPLRRYGFIVGRFSNGQPDAHGRQPATYTYTCACAYTDLLPL